MQRIRAKFFVYGAIHQLDGIVIAQVVDAVWEVEGYAWSRDIFDAFGINMSILLDVPI